MIGLQQVTGEGQLKKDDLVLVEIKGVGVKSTVIRSVMTQDEREFFTTTDITIPAEWTADIGEDRILNVSIIKNGVW